jgi:hypothetical protein
LFAPLTDGAETAISFLQTVTVAPPPTAPDEYLCI